MCIACDFPPSNFSVWNVLDCLPQKLRTFKMRYCWETLKRLITDITQLCYSCVIYVCSFILKKTVGRFCKLPNASIRPCLCNCNKHHILFNTLDAVVDFPQTALNLYLKYVKTFQMSLWIRCLIWELRYYPMQFTHHLLFPALLPFTSFLSLWLYLFYMRLLVNRSPRVPHRCSPTLTI